MIDESDINALNLYEAQICLVSFGEAFEILEPENLAHYRIVT